jgi:hypothetical protein
MSYIAFTDFVKFHPSFDGVKQDAKFWITGSSARKVSHVHTSPTMSTTIKGLSPSQNQYDGSSMRVAIVHGRWNNTVVDALVRGAIAKLKERGVKEKNIIVESVPGSFELPLACAKCVVFHIVGSRS